MILNKPYVTGGTYYLQISRSCPAQGGFFVIVPVVIFPMVRYFRVGFTAYLPIMMLSVYIVGDSTLIDPYARSILLLADEIISTTHVIVIDRCATRKFFLTG